MLAYQITKWGEPLEERQVETPAPQGTQVLLRVTASGVRGAATGIVIGAGAGFGIGVTPWLLGAAADAWSFQAGISVLGAMVMLSSLCVLRIERV